MHNAMPPNHLFYSSVLADLRMPSTALVNAHRASSRQRSPTRYHALVLFLRFWEQGARSGDHGGRGNSCTSLSWRKSTVVAAVCALTFSRWRKRPRSHTHTHTHTHPLSPGFGRRWTQNSRSSGDSGARASPLWLSVCPQEEMVATRPDFQKKEAAIFLLCPAWSFGVVTDCVLVSGSHRQFRRLSELARSILNGLRWTFAIQTAATQTCPRRCWSVSCLNGGGGGLPAPRFLTRRWSCNMDVVAAVSMLLIHSWISRALINFSAASTFVT